jgi:hypothetical protein
VVRPLLLGGGGANLMIGMGLPAILPIAFLLSGAGAAAWAVTPGLPGAVVAMAASGIGNAVFAVSIRSALMRAAPPDVRGTVMADRFSLAQAAQVLGLGLGAVAVAAVGARWDFALMGAGLGAVALVAVALVWSVYRRQLPPTGLSAERAGRTSGGGANGEADQGPFWP